VVVDRVDPDGAAAEAGLKEGDLIRQVNGKAVHSAAEFRQALHADAARPALVLVQRGEGSFFATLDAAS
jgi:S1-C subfamily serine protease